MTPHSLTTRLDHSINTRLPETPAPQRKAFRDFGAALLVVRPCCQASLARGFAHFAAASRRQPRWWHNPRLEPQAQARAHALAVGPQLPLSGTVRSALDWTTETQQPLRVAARVVGRRAVPGYWDADPTAELKGAQRALAQAFVAQRLGTVRQGLAQERRRVTADRGVCPGDCLAVREHWGGPFVLRLTARVTVGLDQQGGKLGRLQLRRPARRRAWGRWRGMRRKPHR